MHTVVPRTLNRSCVLSCLCWRKACCWSVTVACPRRCMRGRDEADTTGLATPRRCYGVRAFGSTSVADLQRSLDVSMILGLHARPITMTCVPAPVSHASIHAHHSISLNSSLATYISHIYLYRCLCWLLRETRSVLNRLLPSIPYICALSSAAFRVRLGSRDRPARRNNLLACKTAALAGRETHPTTNILVPIAFPIWHWHSPFCA
jgi:hypothetical protein